MQAEVTMLSRAVPVRAMVHDLKVRAHTLKRDVHAIYLAAHNPRVPWHVKILALSVAGYALSPIDLIPDFIPVIGYLDDLIIVPLGIWLVLSLIPEEVMAAVSRQSGRGRAASAQQGAQRSLSLRFGLLARPYWVGPGFASWRRHRSQRIAASPR